MPGPTGRTEPMFIVNPQIAAALEEFGAVAGRDFLVSEPLPAELDAPTGPAATACGLDRC